MAVRPKYVKASFPTLRVGKEAFTDRKPSSPTRLAKSFRRLAGFSDVYVGETVWVKTWGVGCTSGAPINIDTTPQVEVPADDLTYYWVTTKQ